MNIKHFLGAFMLLAFCSCTTSIDDQYVDTINQATEDIKNANTFDDIKAATKQLIDFEHQHREALDEALKGNPVKQAKVDKAYKLFMQTGMSRSSELGRKSIEDTVAQQAAPTNNQ